MSRKPIIFERDERMARRQQRLNRLSRLILLLVVILAIAATSLFFYQLLVREEQTARNRLRTFAELRASAVQRYLTAHRQETALWASQPEIQRQARHFVALWQHMTPRERTAVRNMLSPVHADNARAGNPAGLDTTRTDAVNAYLALYRKTQASMQAFLEHHGYANLHVITPEGDLVFSVHRRADFGSNLAINGSVYAGRALGQAFQRALRLVSPGLVVFEDFSPYPGREDMPRAFLAAPLLELEGNKLGVLAIELDIAPISNTLAHHGALGQHALIYAVGPDMLLRNNLPGHPQPTALRLRMDSPAIRKALDGEQVISVRKAQNGKRIAVALPMDFDSIRWAVVTEMPVAEMRAPYRPYMWLWAVAVALILLLGGVQFWMLRHS